MSRRIIVIIKIFEQGVFEMIECINMSATVTEDLSSLPRIKLEKGENHLPQAVS